MREWTVALANTMKQVRSLKGLSMPEHAKQLGLPKSTLWRIEDGQPCDVDTLVRIHKMTGVKYEILLGSSSKATGGQS